MITLHNGKVRITDGRPVPCEDCPDGRKKTLAWSILSAHNRSGLSNALAIHFDSLISHDITYVGIIQTAAASGLEQFPLPYVLTNCHNSLCAVGGTINADDHAFGLSAAKRYGGIFVPPNLAVIHQYAREELSGCGRMILGSDSHTRYGPLGTMGVGEGGGELVKQLLGDTWDAPVPEVVLVWLTGTPPKGVGPHDAAIALCGATYKNNFVKNKVLEFAGPGITGLSMDYRIGIDVMTTETACLSSIWTTDEKVEEYYAVHGRSEAYKPLALAEGAVYDALITIDLSRLEPMAALPFHPSEAVTVRQLLETPGDYLREIEKRAAEQSGGKAFLHLTDSLVNGKPRIQQGVIAGCAGGMYDNLAEAAAILNAGGEIGDFTLTAYPPSIPVQMELTRSGVFDALTDAGAVMKPCFCGPCFGAGDVPANDTLSIRHTTRNFPNREGSRPGDGQAAAVLLMDARTIAATAANGGFLTSAMDIDYTPPAPVTRHYDVTPYRRRVHDAWGKAQPEVSLRFGPNITPWPEIPELSEHLLLRLAAVIHDAVTTTDELIPSGETSSYRSNPLKLAEFALSRREPAYVGRAKATQTLSNRWRNGDRDEKILNALSRFGCDRKTLDQIHIGSLLYAEKPGDGSAREQAASCQRVLGGCANICREYATKRYRANCVNWGMLPFTIAPDTTFNYTPDDWVWIPNIRTAIKDGKDAVDAKILHSGTVTDIRLLLPGLTEEEREILLTGCLMNWYKSGKGGVKS